MGMWDNLDGVEAPETDDADLETSDGAQEQPEGEQPAPDSEGDTGALDGSEKLAEGAKDEKASSTDTDFDLDGVKFEGLTTEQIEALGRGVALNKDYTTKTQKLAVERQDLDNTYKELQTNPLKLREYFSPEHLMHALGMNPNQRNVAPTAPNAPAGKDKFEAFEPEAANLLREYDQGIQEARREIQGLRAKFGEFDNRFQKTDDANAQVEIEKEVGDALTHYPALNNENTRAYNRQLILMKIAATPTRSAMDIADEISKFAPAARTATAPVSNNKTRVVGPGASVPMGPKTPSTFDEAEQSSHARFGTTFVR